MNGLCDFWEHLVCLNPQVARRIDTEVRLIGNCLISCGCLWIYGRFGYFMVLMGILVLDSFWWKYWYFIPDWFNGFRSSRKPSNVRRQHLRRPRKRAMESFRLYCSFTNSDFLKIQLVPAQASWQCFFLVWRHPDLALLEEASQGSVGNLSFGHRYNILGARIMGIHTKRGHSEPKNAVL